MARISIGNFDFIINSGGGGSADLTDLKNRVTSLESQLNSLPLQIVGESTQVGSSIYDLNLNTKGSVTINNDKVVATTDQIESWATVGNDKVIPSSKLPSFVDDVVEVAELPEVGEAGKIYILTTDNTQYRWSGSEFVQITSGGVVIGSVAGTAYDGGKGTALEGRVTAVEETFVNTETMNTAISEATKNLVTQEDLEEATADLATKDEIKNYGDGTVGEGFQLGLADKRMNLNSNGSVMVNSVGEVVVATPYPGEEGRKVIQLANHDSLSGIGTDGSTGGNLVMLSKFDVADFGSKNFHTNINVKEDNGHDGRVTVNDDNEIAYLSDVPSLDGYATTQNVSDSIAAEASARNKAIETATSDLVHNTLTVAGKSLTENITLVSTDLTDGDELARKDEILDTVVNENTNETLRQSLTARTHLPFAVTNPNIQNKTEAQIFAYFDSSVIDKVSLRNYLQSNMAYIAYNFDSLGQHQYYKLPIVMASVPDSGDISVIAMGPDIYGDDKLTKFTYTITLNGDASSVVIDKKVLEN